MTACLNCGTPIDRSGQRRLRVYDTGALFDAGELAILHRPSYRDPDAATAPDNRRTP